MSRWGKQFVTAPLSGRTKDTFRILADIDGTHVTITSSEGQAEVTLGGGEFHELLTGVPLSITADKPVTVAQYSNGSTFDGTISDPFMVVVPPFEQYFTSYVVATPAQGFQSNFINVTVPTAAAGVVTLDGTAVAAEVFTPIGGSGYSSASIPVEPGTHKLKADVPFGVLVYGFDSDDSYGYAGGSGAGAVATVAAVELTPAEQNAVVGGRACVTAKVTDASGSGLPGIRIDLSVAGAHTVNQSVVTSADGTVPFCYEGAKEGTDTVNASTSGTQRSSRVTWATEAANQAPTATAQSVSTAQDAAKVVTLAGTDPDGDSLTFAIGSGPSHGTLSGTGATRTYTPAAGYSGDDSFTFTVNDGALESVPATVSITVTAAPPVNRVPTATAQSVSTAQDAAKVVTLAGTDPDGDSLTFAIGSGPSHGTLSGTGATRTYTPAAGYSGDDSFTFTVNDGALESVPATVSITVTAAPPVNRVPTATAQSVSTAQEAAKVVTLAGTDPDGDSLTFAIGSGPSHGTLSGTGATRTYTPAAGYSGDDSFTFTVNDGALESVPATVSITVTAAPPVPKIPSTTTLTVSPTHKLTSQKRVTLIATVSPARATGEVQFSDSGHILGTATLSGGTATLKTQGLYGGTQSLVAEYLGNDTVAGSVSAPVVVTVRDKKPPSITRFKIRQGAAPPTATFLIRDAGGVREAQVRYRMSQPTKTKLGPWSEVTVLAGAATSWTGAAVPDRTKMCVSVRAVDYAGNWSKWKTKCRILRTG